MGIKNYIKLASIYIGTVIGAGFASGREIIQFFGVYGYRGLYGIIVASVLFSVIGALILLRVFKNRINGYEKFIQSALGKNIGLIIEIIITLFLIVGYCIMLAGSGAILYQQFKINYIYGIYIMVLSTLITFLFNIKGISIVNVIIVPLLLIGVVTTGTITVLKEGLIFSNFNGSVVSSTGNWLTSSILYVSYNSISAIVIMSSLLPIISDEKTAIKGGVLGGVGLGILAAFIYFPSLVFYTDIYSIEIPMLKIADYIGDKTKVIYSLILWGAMFTTAVSNGYGVIRRISKLFKLDQKFFALIFCFSVIPLANVGFSKLVSTLYPLFGYLGLFMLLSIMTSHIKLIR